MKNTISNKSEPSHTQKRMALIGFGVATIAGIFLLISRWHIFPSEIEDIFFLLGC